MKKPPYPEGSCGFMSRYVSSAILLFGSFGIVSMLLPLITEGALHLQREVIAISSCCCVEGDPGTLLTRTRGQGLL